jgi:hypothetical protein
VRQVDADLRSMRGVVVGVMGSSMCDLLHTTMTRCGN